MDLQIIKSDGIRRYPFLRKFAVIVGLLMIVILSGCRNESHNGTLDGYWQVREIETLINGESVKPDPTLYYAFYMSVVQMSGSTRVTGNMQYDKKGDVMILDFPYQKDSKGEALLASYGIYSNPVKFSIVKLAGKELILKSEETILRLHRH